MKEAPPLKFWDMAKRDPFLKTLNCVVIPEPIVTGQPDLIVPL
jgi:hypothetical protein